MEPRGYSCLIEIEPLTIQIERSADGLWTMNLFDGGAGCKVIMPPSEYDLAAAKEKALINAAYYMRKYGGQPSWTPPASLAWRDFSPKSIIWET
jgi:hypothetical protein